jgi:hypothetical protein
MFETAGHCASLLNLQPLRLLPVKDVTTDSMRLLETRFRFSSAASAGDAKVFICPNKIV